MGLYMCPRLKCLVLKHKSLSHVPVLSKTRGNIQPRQFHCFIRPEVKTNNLNILSVQKRTFLNIFRKPTKAQLRIKDNAPDHYQLIYRNTMERYLLLVQLFTSSTAAIVAFLVVKKQGVSDFHLPFSDDLAIRPRETENEAVVYLAAFITVIVILQVYLSRLPLRIYNFPQKQKYVMVFYGNFPFTSRKVTCKVGEIKKLDGEGFTPWQQGKYQLKDGQKLILMDEYFRRSADLYIMLGLQRDPEVETDDNKG